MSDEPAVSAWPARGKPEGVVLVLHGGAEHGLGEVPPWKLAYVRMIPIARALRRPGIEVRLIRNRRYGWDGDPVSDARWALERIRAEHPGVPVVLVGHSMGGRVALRVADDPAVRGICALAPWTPRGEPVDAVAGKDVLVVHGTGDRMTDPRESYAFAERARAVAARVARFEIAREGHAMLRRAGVWTRLTRAFTLEVIDGGSDADLRRAWSAPPADRLRIPV